MSAKVRTLTVLALALSVAACGQSQPRNGTATSTPSLVAPLTSAVTTATAAWVVVPMGRVTDPLNTFWQLFVRTSSQQKWALVTPRGVADNGGLVLSAGQTRDAVVGIRPSQLLTFTPLALTHNAGSTFTPDLLPAALEATPDSLATSSTGAAVAVVNSGTGIAFRRALGSPWTTSTNISTLGTSSLGRRCRPTSITSVATVASTTYIGVACSRPGTLGLFELSRGAALPVTAPVPAGQRASTFVIDRLIATNNNLEVLARSQQGSSASYVLLLRRASTAAWQHASTVNTDGSLVSTSVASDGAIAIVSRSPSGEPKGVIFRPAKAAWVRMPAPPRSAVVVALVGAGLQAIAADGTQFRVYTYQNANQTWLLTQSMTVPITYGSSH